MIRGLLVLTLQLLFLTVQSENMFRGLSGADYDDYNTFEDAIDLSTVRSRYSEANGLGNHTYCGPYAKTYDNRKGGDCPELDEITGWITLENCEYECKKADICTAYNWKYQGKEKRCQLLRCANGIGQAPYPTETDSGWVSFSKEPAKGETHCAVLDTKACDICIGLPGGTNKQTPPRLGAGK